MTQDRIEDVIAIGERNAELISLALGWCKHPRADRSMMGIGLVEEMTGLPISGGRLTCDYAENPPRFSGMQLEKSALVLYEQNCRGCQYRDPGGIVPNLSTWAEPILALRAQEEEARETEAVEATDRLQERTSRRSLVAAGSTRQLRSSLD
jgi:hypothetical protein